MNSAELRIKLLEEIEQIPDDRLVELYQVIQALKPNARSKDPMSFAGCWDDLPEDTYQEFLDEISDRRQAAFSQRRSHDSRLD